jgi:hypothetical protein
MEMTDELSPAEQDLAAELSNLASDPSTTARAEIMHAVVAAARPTDRVRRLPWAWRTAVAVPLALIMVLATTVFAFAASSTALPDSPAYGIRSAGEHVRLTILGPTDRELLRIAFAREHFRQAQDVVHRNRSDASQLLSDGRAYLDDARNQLPSVPAGEQGQVENELDQAGQEQTQTENQVGQQGEH